MRASGRAETETDLIAGIVTQFTNGIQVARFSCDQSCFMAGQCSIIQSICHSMELWKHDNQ